MRSAIYFPTVRGRAGEIEAIVRLSPEARARIAMVVDLPTKELDPRQTLDDYVGRFASSIAAAWGPAYPIYLDLNRYAPDHVDSKGRPIIEHLFDCVRQKNLRAIPVAGTDRGPGVAYIDAVARIAHKDGRGAALRLAYEDFNDVDILEREIVAALKSLALPHERLDVFLDVGSIAALPLVNADEESLLHTVIEAVGVLKQFAFRNLVFIGSSVPETLPATADGKPREFVRTELRVWKELVARKALPLIHFGDTGVWNPRQLDSGGGGGGPPPARVRLPLDDRQVFFRAENSRYREICQEAMRYPGVKDLPQCWGLDTIRRCQIGAVSCETASAWVARDMNTHIEVTTRTVESNLRRNGRLEQLTLEPVQSSPWRQETFLEIIE